MKLSIIIPVYNAQEYLAECLECLLAQELDINEYEIILVNDGSTDNSLSIMNEYSQKYSNIKVFSNCNKGQGYCRNFGIKKSHGEYIYFIDSDDLIERKFLGKLIDIVEIYTLDFLGFGIITNHKYTRYNHPLFHVDTNIAISSYEIKTGIQTVADFSYNNGPWWYIFRKKILVENNFEFEEEHLFEDGLFTTELLICAQRVIILSVKLYYYFKNAESTTTTNNKEKRLKRIEDMYFVIFKFKYLINLAKSKLANDAAIKRLKNRQESYVLFLIVRELRNKTNFNQIKNRLLIIQKELNAYPISYHKEEYFYSKVYAIMTIIINNMNLLKFVFMLNKIFNFLK